VANRRTYEILAKWIAKKQGITIEFKPDITPQVNTDTNHIILPSNIDEQNIYAALAQLMHEAAHLRYTKGIPIKEIVSDQLSFELLNAIEDIRIDQKNFRILPNIHAFYERLIDHVMEWRKENNVQPKDIPLHRRVLGDIKCDMEDFRDGKWNDPETKKLIDDHDIYDIIYETINDLEHGRWPKVKATIQKLMKIFKLDKLPKQPIGQPGDCGTCGGSGEVAQPGEEEGGKIKCPDCGGTGKEGFGNEPGKEKVFGTKPGTGTCPGSSAIGEVAMEELTKQKFRELLNVKEKRTVYDGHEIDSDNLTAFLTGDIDELFTEERVVRNKKSKIAILIDASGSMDCELMDGEPRREVVGGCIKNLVEILDEVMVLEGINVDYQVGGFTEDYHPFQKETWEKEYTTISGGTNLLEAFNQVHGELVADQEIDGNRLMIMFTDGEVDNSEVVDMKKAIMRHGEDVRCMIIGVGADLNSHIVKEVVGDHNILVKEAADLILIETIMQML